MRYRSRFILLMLILSFFRKYRRPLLSNCTYQRKQARDLMFGQKTDLEVQIADCAGNTDDDTIETWLRLGNSGYNPETSYVEISACLAFHADAPLAQRELMVWRFRKWGIAHVLFGSDYFKFDGETPLQTLDILSKYPFTEEELNTILTNDGSEWLGQ